MKKKQPTLRLPQDWSMHVSPTTLTGEPYPIFTWDFGGLTGENVPLYASAESLSFVWAMGAPIECHNVAEVLEQVARHDLNPPQLLEEVEAVMAEFRPCLEEETDEARRGELYKAIERRWRELLRNYHA